jgi:hypothetical protein
LTAAVEGGCFFVVEDATGEPVARAHVYKDQTGATQMGGLSFGSYAKDAVQALAELANHPLVQNGNYDARCLLCKEAFLAVFWLKSADSGFDDLIYPLGRSINPLAKENPPHKASDFMEALAPLASKRLGRIVRGNQMRRARAARVP